NTLQHEIGGIIPVEPQGGKEVRAYAVTAQFEAGNIYIPHPAWRPEIDDYITELTSFPTAAHDDEVDSTTQGLTYMEKSNNLFARYGM
ncbi:phage terminase large subunit, partial [Lentilactobacillus diolivorans]